MDFVLALHSHLPYVLRHGRWPHGSDWLCEAALDSYLPLLEKLRELNGDGVPAPLTIGFSPVLANQLVDPEFAHELEAFFAQRLLACAEARRTLSETGDAELLPLADFWEARIRRLRELYRAVDGDLASAFRALADHGVIEIVTCAATHGYLPLLGRDESVRLQLFVARAEHGRLFGRAPTGCWIPECAYRPRGWWAPLPDAPHPGVRAGVEERLAEAGLRYFFTDAHLARAGSALGGYAEIPLGAERFDAERHDPSRYVADGHVRTPYRAYRARSADPWRTADVLVRDPRSSLQVWSRQLGYPGDEWYLEFHKMRWPGGLKLWRVSWANVDLGAKRPYDPATARSRAASHASHFVSLLAGLATTEAWIPGAVVVAPFDTELFGHWWFEGVDFLAEVYRALAERPSVRPVTGAQHLCDNPPTVAIQLAAGSWGAGGDDSMWLNEGTAWTWRRLWSLEERFWDVAPWALSSAAAQPVLAQAARELLLAQASDWQFLISTAAVTDYAERRFALHCGDAEALVAALETAEGGGDLEGAQRRAEELAHRDALFPEVLSEVARAVGARRPAESGR